mmetsp:Transcript_59501/g.117923  ORF Transcript_59501/g.117923 Transcript_59501/m.117923 type:complete len:200 (-) Transcript_59501:599-1198(-)
MFLLHVRAFLERVHVNVGHHCLKLIFLSSIFICFWEPCSPELLLHNFLCCIAAALEIAPVCTCKTSLKSIVFGSLGVGLRKCSCPAVLFCSISATLEPVHVVKSQNSLQVVHCSSSGITLRQTMGPSRTPHGCRICADLHINTVHTSKINFQLIICSRSSIGLGKVINHGHLWCKLCDISAALKRTHVCLGQSGLILIV